MDSLTLNGHVVEFHEMDEATGLIRFKLDNTWRNPADGFIPQCTAFDFIMRYHSRWPFWSRELKDFASNSEVRRWLDNSAARFNGRAMKPKEVLDFPLYSVILFPKGQRITLL